MDLGAKLTKTHANSQKHRQIRRLGDPNPMDHVPGQDSAKIPEKKIA